MLTPHTGPQANWARSPRQTTCTFRRFGKTASPTVRRRGSGQSSLTTGCTCAATTGSNRDGIKGRYVREPAVFARGGVTKDVVFEPVDGSINDRIDEAYRAKYAGSPYLKPMIGARARSATVRVRPA